MTGISQDLEVCPYSGWCKYLTFLAVLDDLTVPESCLAIACHAMDISSQNQHLLQLHELKWNSSECNKAGTQEITSYALLCSPQSKVWL